MIDIPAMIKSRTRYSEFLGKDIRPSAHEIVTAIAETEQAVIQPHGAYAANQLGLSLQVPAKPIYLTTGLSHEFYLGNLKVEMRHEDSLLPGAAGLAEVAVKYLGGVTPKILTQIAAKLNEEDFRTFCIHCLG